jgi:heptosyltransferase-1
VNPLKTPPIAERILVVRLGAIGDVVRTLPAVSALRAGYPNAHIAWLVEPASASALNHQPWIDEVLAFPRPLLGGALRAGRLDRFWRLASDFATELRRRRFDLALDFHAILKSGCLARLSGARLCVGYGRPFAREGAGRFAHLRARLSHSLTSRYARNLALVRFLGIDAPPSPRPFRIPEEHRSWARDALGDEAAIILHPGSSPTTPHKRWSGSRYASLARSLDAQGYATWISFGSEPGERAGAEAIVARAAGRCRLAPATPSLVHLGALLERARLYVGGDTGPLHIASLVGTPVVQIVGPTDPVENAPYPETPARSVRVPVGCSPCRRGCSAAVCMRVVSPASVLEAARELLALRREGC